MVFGEIQLQLVSLYTYSVQVGDCLVCLGDGLVFNEGVFLVVEELHFFNVSETPEQIHYFVAGLEWPQIFRPDDSRIVDISRVILYLYLGFFFLFLLLE